MSATATSPAAPRLQLGFDSPARSRPRSISSATIEPVNPHHRGGRVLFEIRFTSPMSDLDLDRLRSVLDLSTHMYPKMRPDPNSPGVARVDHYSGLFLERGAGESQWLLQARTWGRPAPQTVHEWQLLAAQAAHQLDPRVSLPGRSANPRPAVAERPLGQTASKRLARIRRRLAGLP
jgi:hypothetical protein